MSIEDMMLWGTCQLDRDPLGSKGTPGADLPPLSIITPAGETKTCRLLGKPNGQATTIIRILGGSGRTYLNPTGEKSRYIGYHIGNIAGGEPTRDTHSEIEDSEAASAGDKKKVEHSKS